MLEVSRLSAASLAGGLAARHCEVCLSAGCKKGSEALRSAATASAGLRVSAGRAATEARERRAVVMLPDAWSRVRALPRALGVALTLLMTDTCVNDAAADKIRKYRADYNNRPPNNVSFMPAIASASWRLHSEFVRLLLLQAHRETDSNILSPVSRMRTHI